MTSLGCSKEKEEKKKEKKNCLKHHAAAVDHPLPRHIVGIPAASCYEEIRYICW